MEQLLPSCSRSTQRHTGIRMKREREKSASISTPYLTLSESSSSVHRASAQRALSPLNEECKPHTHLWKEIDRDNYRCNNCDKQAGFLHLCAGTLGQRHRWDCRDEPSFITCTKGGVDLMYCRLHGDVKRFHK